MSRHAQVWHGGVWEPPRTAELVVAHDHAGAIKQLVRFARCNELLTQVQGNRVDDRQARALGTVELAAITN